MVDEQTEVGLRAKVAVKTDVSVVEGHITAKAAEITEAETCAVTATRPLMVLLWSKGVSGNMN